MPALFLPALNSTPAGQLPGFLASLRLSAIGDAVALIFAVFVRLAVGLGPYSGYRVPPLHGDFEAQRHWMEVTIHLPANLWYYYDLSYWGIDYPPLTAYHSWLLGKVAHALDPSWVALDASRGLETTENKLFMRWSVLVSDFVVFFPAVFMFCRRMFPNHSSARQTALLIILLQPGLILVDHGHFQYNSVMLGLALLSVIDVSDGRYLLGSIAFSLSLGFKQMALYYAPVIFAFLLGQCLRRADGMQLFIKLGLTVVSTFALLVYPWVGNPAGLLQVLTRLFPFNRGLFEDKVANVWCAVNVVVKLRQVLDQKQLVRLCLIATLSAIGPACLHLASNPTPRRMVYAMANCSLGFFLFSFQVHEKSILIPAMPVTLLMVSGDAMDFAWGGWFINTAVFSMYPLLKKDGLSLQYICMLALWNWLGLFWSRGRHALIFTVATRASYVVMLLIHIFDIFVPPPVRFPDLYPLLNATFSAGLFALSYLYYIYRQLNVTADVSFTAKKKR